METIVIKLYTNNNDIVNSHLHDTAKQVHNRLIEMYEDDIIIVDLYDPLKALCSQMYNISIDNINNNISNEVLNRVNLSPNVCMNEILKIMKNSLDDAYRENHLIAIASDTIGKRSGIYILTNCNDNDNIWNDNEVVVNIDSYENINDMICTISQDNAFNKMKRKNVHIADNGLGYFI